MGEIKAKAESYFIRIGDGHRNSVKRPWDLRVDRSLRAMVEFANHNGDCIVNDGEGYFRPIPGDEVDRLALNSYFRKEESRIKKEQLKLESMKQTYEGWRKEALYADHQRETE